MPIETLPLPSESATFPDGIDRLGQRLGEITRGPDLTPEPQPAPGWRDSWLAQVGTSWMQSAADAVYRDRDYDPLFNPFARIRSDPTLANDPGVLMLAERGQFDGSRSEREFQADLVTGRRFLEDAGTLELASTAKSLATMAGVAIGDPTNLIPVGGALKVARGASLARRTAVFAEFGAAGGLAFKAIQNEAQPASNEPGIGDELMTMGMAAGFSAGIGLLTSPAMTDRIGGYLATKKVERIRRDLARMMTEPAVREFDPTQPATTTRTVPIDDEVARGKGIIERMLADEPVDNAVVSVLRRAGDENDALLGQLRTKYEQAGKALHVVEHPDQWYKDMTADVAAILDHPDLNNPASVKDLDGSFIDSAASALSSRYADLQSTVTPGGRLARATLGRVQDVYRTLSGSAQTVTAGSARDPFNFQSGAAAESLKSIYEAAKDRTVMELREVFQAARRKGEAVTWDRKPVGNYEDFRAAVNDLLRREHAAAKGYDAAIPADVAPSIRAGADRMRAYFNRMRDEAERVGLLEVGPDALARVQGEASTTERRLAAAQNRTAKAKAAGKDAARITALEQQEAARLAEHQAATAKVASVQRAVDVQGKYLPRVYDIAAVLGDEAGFKARLVEGFEESDSIVNGKKVPQNLRPLVPQVAEEVGVRRALGGAGDDEWADVARTLVEGDLSPEVLTAYRAKLAEFYRAGADDAFESLTKPGERHGVADALTFTNPMARRAVELNEARILDFLETDPDRILEKYHHTMGGRIAVRRSIQLNPSVAGAVLKDGTPITTGEHLMSYLRETVDTLDTFARTADAQAGRKVGARGSLLGTVESLRNRVEKDIGLPLSLLEGRDPLGSSRGPVFDAARFLGRSALRLSNLNKLGSVAWAQINDLAPVSLYMMKNPRSLAIIPRAVLGLKTLPKRDLEVLGLMFDRLARSRSFGEVDFVGERRGFGTGATRRISASIERGSERLSDTIGKVALLDWITNTNKRVSGAILLDDLTRNARKVVAADDLVKAGKSEADALAKVRLNRYDAARFNKLGLTADAARTWLRLTWEHGIIPDGNNTPLRSRYAALAEFIAADADGAVVHPNFEEWNLADRGVRDVVDRVMANLNAEVERSMVVTPGAFDRPLANQTIIGKLFNQFQSFGMAFVNQRLRVMAQMPAKYQLWYLMQYQMLGAISDAISNDLAGRRSLDETAREWQQNPLGMSYAAWERSGLAGWWGRPIAIADAMNIPYSPGNLTGNTVGSSAARHVQPGRLLTFLGPAASDLDRAGRVVSDVAAGRADSGTAYQGAKLLPYQNLLWLRLMHRATGAPVVPEAIRPEGEKR